MRRVIHGKKLNRLFKVLYLPFQNNFTDFGESGMVMTAGATANYPTFALSGRKPGEYCAVFNGSQSIKTTTDLPINSDKSTILFSLAANTTARGVIVELSADFDSSNSFSVEINKGATNNLNAGSHIVFYNEMRFMNAYDNVWHRYAVVFDRSNDAANEIKIYKDSVLISATHASSWSNDGNFSNAPLFVGQRGGSSFGFVGKLMYLKILNSAYTQSNVDADYAEWI